MNKQRTNKEQWKEINEFPNYEVSNLGRVRSLRRTITTSNDRIHKLGGRILKQGTTSRGYKNVTLYNEGGNISKNVHRLVLIAFVPNPKNLPSVNHKNENKQDNRLKNLEWCTQQYNSTYNDVHLRRSKKLYQYNLDMELLNIWDNAGEAIVELPHIFRQGISAVAQGNANTHGGFIWSYEEIFFSNKTLKQLDKIGKSLEAIIEKQVA